MFNDNEIVKLVFGLKVRTLRQNKGLSYQQMAETTGIAVSYLHDIENGKKYPKANKILALAKALEVDYDYMVSLNAGKKLQPVIQLLTSDLMNVIPWEHFGISVPFVLSLFVNTPDKVTAFISTMIKIFRTYEMSKENFYTTALRSYQELNDNYFSDLELSVLRFKKENNINRSAIPTNEQLETILAKKYGVTVDYKKLKANKTLSGIRSYYNPERKILYINKLQSSQELFLLAKEVAFHFLDLTERPLESIMYDPSSFDVVLHNFYASYFAAAMIIPEENLVDDLTFLFQQSAWNPAAWIGVFEKYPTTPEMLFQRMTNMLPHHFGIDQLFFLRMNNLPNEKYALTKELHLSQLHNPHANSIHEHYCRRWLAIKHLNAITQSATNKKIASNVFDIQLSNYWQTMDNYLLISMSKLLNKEKSEAVSVTIGMYIDTHLKQLLPFLKDEKIPSITVHTTCERCSITDCKERAAAPVIVAENEKRIGIDKALASL